MSAEEIECAQWRISVVNVVEGKKSKGWAQAALIVGADIASKLLEGGRSLESERQVTMDPLRTAGPDELSRADPDGWARI